MTGMKSLMVVLAIGAVGGPALGQKPGPKPPRPAPAPAAAQPAQPEGRRDEARIRARQKELRDVLAELADEIEDLNRAPDARRLAAVDVIKARHRAIQADLDLCATVRERVAVLEQGVAAFKKFEQAVSAEPKDQGYSRLTVLTARAARVEAELTLERARPAVSEPDRVGQIKIESAGTKLRDGQILKLVEIYPGQVLAFSSKDEAVQKLRQAFPKFDVEVQLGPNPLEGFVDVTVRIGKREKARR